METEYDIRIPIAYKEKGFLIMKVIVKCSFSSLHFKPSLSFDIYGTVLIFSDEFYLFISSLIFRFKNISFNINIM